MTAAQGEMAGGRRGEGGGLFASAPNALPKIIRGKITARWCLTGAENGLDRAWKQDSMIKETQHGREQESYGKYRITINIVTYSGILGLIYY